MIILVCGRENSGKSAKAEEIFSGIEAAGKYYIATMKVFDEAGVKRVEKHRKAREGKGFITLEIPYRVDRALDEIEDKDNSAALLECLSNLAGNEMYDDPERAVSSVPTQEETEALADAVICDIMALSGPLKALIVVANFFPDDLASYDEMTRAYVRLNNLLSDKMRRKADKVVDI